MTSNRKVYKEVYFIKRMEKTVNQVEKNVSASFGYVKKDILMLNDSYMNLQNAINQLTTSYNFLEDEIKKIRKDLDSLIAKRNEKKMKKK